MRQRANRHHELALRACAAAACGVGAEAVIRIVGHDRQVVLTALEITERSASSSGDHDVATVLRAALRRLAQDPPTPAASTRRKLKWSRLARRQLAR
jgi:hypothetical protein